MSLFQDLVQEKVEKKRSKETHSLHEAYSRIAEEVDELWDQVKMKRAERDYYNVLHELVDIAGYCQKAAEDLGLEEFAAHVKPHHDCLKVV